ncbi:MAG: tRNA (guanosine(37)-N1)-methyltransferase TrmD [Pseudomonadales bacterium]|nr:tRNA (guanosine(37)-N1)-methyltransferase TrmD [Pseudomonadales bacterium]
MWLGVITLFPEMFRAVSEFGISRRAFETNIMQLEMWNPRDFTLDRHKTVDDKPYGGGPGMLMKVAPLRAAINAAKKAAGGPCKVVYLSPQGRQVDQRVLAQLAVREKMILVAGRYEGIDERLIEADIDEEYSIGDYVLSGGELPAMVLIDGMTRLQAGAVGDAESVEMDSFMDGLLDHPHYTRPDKVDGMEVPGILLSGNHQAIERWRLKQSIGRTHSKRPDLLVDRELTDREQNLLNEYLEELIQKRELEEKKS